MDAGAIKLRVYTSFGDVDGNFLDDVMFYSWLNEACRVIYSKTRSLKVSGTIDLVTDVSVYGLPADLYALDKVTRKGEILLKLSYSKVTLNTLIGQLEAPHGFYCINGRDIIVNAGSIAAGDVLDINYATGPAELTVDADIPDVPEEYHQLLINYCLARANEMSEDFNVADRYQTTFDREVINMRGDGDSLDNSSYPQIQFLED